MSTWRLLLFSVVLLIIVVVYLHLQHTNHLCFTSQHFTRCDYDCPLIDDVVQGETSMSSFSPNFFHAKLWARRIITAFDLH